MSASVGVPENYSELFSMYRGYVETLVLRLGVAIDSKEDIASDIFVKLYERDVIGMFDPNHQGWHGQQAKFKTFLLAFVASYARGMRDRANKRRSREPLLCDSYVEHNSGIVPWIAIYGPVHEDPQFLVYENREIEAKLTARLRQRLSEIESPGVHCDLLLVFDEMVRQAQKRETLSYPELSSALGISVSSLRTWVKWITEQLREEVHKL